METILIETITDIFQVIIRSSRVQICSLKITNIHFNICLVNIDFVDPTQELALDERIRKIQAANEARMERHKLMEKEKQMFS